MLYAMALGSVTLWGASFPLTKVAMAEIGPTGLAFLRWAISALALFAWLVALASRPARRVIGITPAAASAPQTGLMPLVKGHGLTIAWVALTGVTLFYYLENMAMRYTTATNASVLSNFTSVFIVLISALVLRERLAVLEWLAMGLAFVGAALVSVGASRVSFGGESLRGDVLMVAASFFGAIYSIGGKRLSEQHDPLAVTTLVAAVGALFLLPLALLEGLHLDLSARVWAYILVLGIGSGALANLWWMVILRHTRASRAAAALLLIPVVSAALAVTLLHEPLTPTIILGALLVLGGVVVVQRRA
ncbi:MAG: aromatic amino acid exporter [Chloroflexi bacterium ADurb.Bin325]|nr:MAG: aromatic amino acid exporter [Chloroflexi bacterium ADurb.Bin325]